MKKCLKIGKPNTCRKFLPGAWINNFREKEIHENFHQEVSLQFIKRKQFYTKTAKPDFHSIHSHGFLRLVSEVKDVGGNKDYVIFSAIWVSFSFLNFGK